MMVQDVFESYVIPRVETKFKEMFVISDEFGRPIVTETDAMLENPSTTFELKFYHGKVEDWVGQLKQLRSDDYDYRFPFVYLNSDRLTLDVNGNCTIGEMVIATMGAVNNEGSPASTSTQRDIQSYKPYLNNLALLLLDAIRSNFGVSNPVPVEIKNVYKGEMENAYGEYVDAILFTNLKLRILNNC